MYTLHCDLAKYTLHGDLAKCTLHGNLAKYTLHGDLAKHAPYYVARCVHRIIISLMCTQSNVYTCRNDDSAHITITVPSWVQLFQLIP